MKGTPNDKIEPVERQPDKTAEALAAVIAALKDLPSDEDRMRVLSSTVTFYGLDKSRRPRDPYGGSMTAR